MLINATEIVTKHNEDASRYTYALTRILIGK
jgi:hypothetical protein